MDVRKLMLMVGALLIAAVTAIFARNLLSTNAAAPAVAAEQQAAKGPRVLVAVKDLPAGTILDEASFAFQPWPKDMVDKAYFLQAETAPASLSGKVVRIALTAGQPLTQTAVIGPGERGYLAAALGPGMRAVTVTVSDATGVAGFVFPGDRIDLMLTHEVPALDDGLPLKVSETILRNVRVLAIDQSMTDPEDGKPSVSKTITLEVAPKHAEVIAVSQSLGQLSMSLRSIADNAAELERAIANGEIEVPEGKNQAADKAMILALSSRPVDANPTFTVGGEASRFARSTMPRPKPTQTAGGAAPTDYAGPVVRIARGNEVSAVPLGGK